MEKAKKDKESLFKELARRTEGLSEIEKEILISEVKIEERPSYHTFDSTGQGLYFLKKGERGLFFLKGGEALPWDLYAKARINKLKRLEKDKSNLPYS